MRKLFSFLLTTVDGYYEGPNHGFDWPKVDAEFNDFALEQLDEVDMLLFGRVTYEMMAAYWPTPAAEQDDPRITARMNSIPKVVVSGTLHSAGWANTRLIKGVDELRGLKEQPGKSIALFGSSDLTVSLLEMGLVDEVRIMVNPVVLGAGKSAFSTAGERIDLELVKSQPFASGNVLLSYEPSARETSHREASSRPMSRTRAGP